MTSLAGLLQSLFAFSLIEGMDDHALLDFRHQREEGKGLFFLLAFMIKF